MNDDIVRELTNINQIELIYVNRAHKNEYDILTYNIICDVRNIMDDMRAFKRIVAIMEIIKELVSIHNVVFNYSIKTVDALEEDINHKNERVINDLNDATILYSKIGYFTNVVNANKNRKIK